MNNFFEQEHFEDFFRDNLEGYESEPSKQLWSDLENRIPPKPKTNKGLAPFLLILFLIFSIGTSIYFANQDIVVVQEGELVSNQGKSIAKNLSQNECFLDQKSNLLPAKDLSRKVAGQQRTNLKEFNASTINHQELFVQEPDNQATKEFITSEISSINEAEKSSHDLALFHSIKAIEKASIMPLPNVFLPQWRQITPLKENPKQVATWLLEVTYSPNLWTSVKAKNEAYQTKQFLGNVHESANYGILLTERRANGWGFEGGLIYGRYNLNHALNENLEFSYLNNFLDENDVLTGTYLLNVKSPFWKEERPIHVQYFEMRPPFLQDGERVQLTGNYTQRINNFQIPIGANYQVKLNKKLNAILQGGLIFAFLSVQSGSFSDAQLSMESLRIVEAEKMDKQSSESLETYIGLGLEYNLSNQLRLKISPRYSTTIWNRASDDNQINLTSFQLNLGLSYPLNKFSSK